MISMPGKSIRSIVDSRGGIHLSIYLENQHSTEHLRQQISDAIETCRDKLLPVRSQEQIETILEPILRLKNDSEMLRSMQENVAIFRKDDLFRVIHLPTPVQRLTVVADSFHIKPLLSWTQESNDFVWVDLQDGFAKVFAGDRRAVMPMVVIPTNQAISGLGQPGGIFAVANAVLDVRRGFSHNATKLVFLSGTASECDRLARVLRKAQLHPKLIRFIGAEHSMDEAVAIIRRCLRKKELRKLSTNIREFQFAHAMNKVAHSLGQIARLAIQGKVRKLIIADDLQIFGKVHRTSGKLAVTPVQFDHEDDDVLDDIAQVVIANGGDVVVTKQKFIPGNRPALALFEAPPKISLLQPVLSSG
jgi:hypothetical protein